MQQRTITAEHLKLALVARKLRPGTRWAALSNGTATNACKVSRRGSAGWAMHTPPLLSPMARGRMQDLLDRTRSTHGRPEVLRTWGTGMRTLRAEFATSLLQAEVRA